MRLWAALPLAALLLTGPMGGQAQTPEQRVIEATELAPGASLRPFPRPTSTPAAGLPEPTVVRGGAATALAIAASPRPAPRPSTLDTETRVVEVRNIPGQITQLGDNTGHLCGVLGLRGDQLEEPVTGRSAGCGIAEPIRLRIVHGIVLTTPATINCTAARALSQWVIRADEIIGNTGGGLSTLRVVASYACRTRNSQSGARLSEHARGNAIDIAAIGLRNGTELTVLEDWRSNRSEIMRDLHQAACGPFGTVLGPNSDRFHQDHFHFDVASHRSGPYCR